MANLGRFTASKTPVVFVTFRDTGAWRTYSFNSLRFRRACPGSERQVVATSSQKPTTIFPGIAEGDSGKNKNARGGLGSCHLYPRPGQARDKARRKILRLLWLRCRPTCRLLRYRLIKIVIDERLRFEVEF